MGNPGLQPSERPSGEASPQPNLRPTEPVRQSARAAGKPGARGCLSHSSSKYTRLRRLTCRALWAGVSGTCPDYGACPPPLPNARSSLLSGGTLTGRLEPSRQAGGRSQQALWLPTTGGLPGGIQSALLPHPVSRRSGCVITNQVSGLEHHRFLSACLLQLLFHNQKNQSLNQNDLNDDGIFQG